MGRFHKSWSGNGSGRFLARLQSIRYVTSSESRIRGVFENDSGALIPTTTLLRFEGGVGRKVEQVSSDARGEGRLEEWKAQNPFNLSSEQSG